MHLMADVPLSPDLEQLVAVNTVHLVHAFDLLCEKQDAVLALAGEVDDDRAGEVRAILLWNKGKPVARALWPKFERKVACGTREVYESMRRAKAYIGGISHNHGCLCSPVGFLGKAVVGDIDLFAMLSAMGSSFYELLPFTSDVSGDQVLTLSEAE
jgi:hypothetical protein